MAELKRKQREKFEVFLRNFNKLLKQSKRLYDVRNKKYNTKSRSRTEQKKYALNSLKLRNKKDYLRKIGKLEEEDNNRQRR